VGRIVDHRAKVIAARVRASSGVRPKGRAASVVRMVRRRIVVPKSAASAMAIARRAFFWFQDI
jgi:hypothetical protein